MRWKWVALIGVFLIIVTTVTIYAILNSYDFNKLKPQIARIVKDDTGRMLDVQGNVKLDIGFPTELVVEDVTLANAAWGSQPDMIKIKRLQARVRLVPLLFGEVKLKRISLEGVDALLETDTAGSGNWEFSVSDSPSKNVGAFSVSSIDIDEVRIENFNLRYRNGETGSVRRFNLADFEVAKKGEPDTLAIQFKADYEKQIVEFSGKIGRLNLLLAHERFPLELSGQFSNVKVKIGGAFDDIMELNGIDLQVNASGTNLAALDIGPGIELPETDTFDVTGRLSGSAEALRLEEVRGELSGAGADLAISGSVGDLIALKGIDLQLQGSGTNLAKIGDIIGRKLPETDEFTIQGRLKGSPEAVSFQEAQGHVRRNNLSFDLDGEIKDLPDLSGIDLQLRGTGQSLTDLKPIIGQKLPETGAFKVQGHLKGSIKSLSLQKARGSVTHNSLRLDLEGEIQDLLTLGGINVNLKGSGKNLAEATQILGEKLPKTDKFTIAGRLTGSARQLVLRDAQAKISRGGLELSLGGKISNLTALRGIDLQFVGSGKNLADFGPIIRQKLPVTDVFKIQGRLTGSTKSLSLHQSQGHARRHGLSLVLNGDIKDLLAMQGIDLKLEGSGKNLAQVGSIIGEKLPETGKFMIRCRLKGSTKSFSLQEIEGHTGRDGLKLGLQGAIKKLPALQGIDLKIKTSGNELAEIEPLIGMKLPLKGPFNMSGHLSGSAKAISLNSISAVVDRSDFKGYANVEFRKRPKIKVRLESAVIDFSPLLESLEKKENELNKSVKPENRLFPEDPLPFDALKKVDADIVLIARNIHARDARFEFGHFSLTLLDENLIIDKLEARYKETKITGNLLVKPDLPPRVVTKFLVQNFDLGGLLKEVGVNDQVQAHIDVAVDVKSKGNSIHTLMANLDGSIGAVMGEGFLTEYLDLLSMDLTQKVIPFWGSHKKAGQINCAIVQFDIKSGLATSRAFVFDTQLGLLTGEGTIDLSTEKIKFLLVPKPKNPSLISLSTKLRVTGSVMDPSVKPDALSLAAKGAKFLSALAIGPLGLLAPFVSLGAHQKHPCEIQDIAQKTAKDG